MKELIIKALDEAIDLSLSGRGLIVMDELARGTNPQEGKAKILPWEKELDYLYTQGALATKFEDRKKYYDKYQEIVYKEKPMIYIYSPIRIVALRNKFKNIISATRILFLG